MIRFIFPAVLAQFLTKSIEKAEVIVDYDAENSNELTVRVGEIVEVINKNVDQDGWWKVSQKRAISIRFCAL